jgi:hypothetical protein
MSTEVARQNYTAGGSQKLGLPEFGLQFTPYCHVRLYLTVTAACDRLESNNRVELGYL